MECFCLFQVTVPSGSFRFGEISKNANPELDLRFGPDLNSDAVVCLLVRCAERWQHAKVILSLRLFVLLAVIHGRLHQLQSLNIRVRDASGTDPHPQGADPFGVAPLLWRLTMYTYRTSPVNLRLPFEQLTSAVGSWDDEFFKVLSLSPNLVSVHTQHGWTTFEGENANDVSLPQLRELSVKSMHQLLFLNAPARQRCIGIWTSLKVLSVTLGVGLGGVGREDRPSARQERANSTMEVIMATARRADEGEIEMKEEELGRTRIAPRAQPNPTTKIDA
ncbi:hypothetical protein B0H11DRAFT_2281756 [Mycena galericulata]|nr:hypothetical protein B0H11DRAFT_2281756 [Mycena galericulata]